VPFVEDLVEVGVDIWQSAQAMNDLEGLKAKYGDRLTINGGWDSNSPANFTGATEDECRQAVRDSIDRLVKLGPGMFFGMVIGEGPEVEQRNAWIFDEAMKYGREALAKRAA
jgi:hypothetical protein